MTGSELFATIVIIGGCAVLVTWFEWILRHVPDALDADEFTDAWGDVVEPGTINPPRAD